MRKILICFCILGVLVLSSMVNAAPTQVFEKYWEKWCGVKSTVDDVRTLAVWPAGSLFVTIDRQSGSQAIPIYNLNSGQLWIKQEYVKMSGSEASIPVANYNIVDGDFTSDGKLIVCSLSYAAAAPLKVFIWDTLTTGPRIIYSSGTAWRSYRLGDAVDVAGSTADNSAVLLISGNNAASKPMKFTTADNGRTWTPTDLANAVRAQELEQETAGGDFWAVYYSSSAPIQKYDSAGLSYGAGAGNQIPNGGNAFGAFALDTAYDRIYTMGMDGSTLPGRNLLGVYEMSTGALLDSFSADRLDMLGPGPIPGAANGSCSCELAVTPGGGHFIYALSERNGCARYSYSTQVNVPADYATIQDAIWAYSAGKRFDPATTTTLTNPLLIAIDPASGPYDTKINLDDALTSGAIKGDLVMKSATPGTLAQIKLQTFPGTPDDGLHVHQNANGFIMKDLLFCPSTTTPITDDLLKFDENSANTTMNWIEFWNVVVTDIKVGGDPMVTNKTEALVGPHPARGSSMGSGDCLIKVWDDAGESLSSVADNLVVYGASSYACHLMMNGIDGEQTYVNNSLFAWSDYQALRIGFYAPATKYARVSGTDAGAGPLNCTAAIQNQWHGIWFSATGDGVCKVDNYLCYVDILGDTTGNDARGISGSGWVDLSLRDSIIMARNACIVDGITNYPQYPATWDRCTFINNSDNPQNTVFAISNSSVLTVKDCIIGGPGTKFSGTTTANVNISNCDIIKDGFWAIGSLGNATQVSGIIQVDPVFANTDTPTSITLFDVRSPLVAGKSSTAGNLVGGADYIGDASPAVCSVTPVSHDFGSVNVGDAATTFTFEVENTGVETLYIYGTTVNGSSDFTINKAPTAMLTAGTTDTLKVLYTPNTQGAQTANVEIAGSIVGSPKLVPVSANGLAPKVGVTGAPVNFGNKILGVPPEDKTFTITNIGNLNLTVNDITKAGSASIYFKAPAPSFPMVILPTNSEIITITYNPDNPGAQTATFTIDSDDPADPLVDVIASGVTIGASYQLVSDPDAYTSGCLLALAECPVDTDLINGVTGIVEDGGWHSAYSGGAAPVTNGDFDADGVTALANDYGLSSPSLVLRWDNLHNATLDKIIIFSGHDGNGTRAFINCKVEVLQGVPGVWNLLGQLTTGSFGQANPANPTVAYTKFEAAGLATGVYGIKFSFYGVANGFKVPYQFEMPGVDAIEGTIIKEIDVCGENYTSVNDWRLIR